MIKHNIILGRTNQLHFRAIMSTVHGVVNFNMIEGPAIVMMENHERHQCYQILAATYISRGTKLKREDMPKEKELINGDYLEEQIRIRDEVPINIRERLIDLLKKYKHVFAWTLADMVGIYRKLTKQMLNIQLGASFII